MKFIVKVTLLLSVILFFNCVSKKEKKLKLSGEIIGTETSSVLLIRPNQDTRFDSIQEIPVKNGKFSYEETLDNPEVVVIAFAESVKKGAYRPMPLFLENDKINITLYSEEEFDKNIVVGGKLNTEYKEFKQKFEDKFNFRLKPIKDSLSVLFNNDDYFSAKRKLLTAELRKTNTQDEKIVIYNKIDDLIEKGQNFSSKAKKLKDRSNVIFNEQKKFQQEYIQNSPTIVSYFFLLKDLQYNKDRINIHEAKSSYQALSQANPNHPYNELALNLINAIESIKVGKKYTDFSTPDINGENVNLSSIIDGKVALLDLWATWCGPCIKKSRTMVPLYNEFKDKGFTVVGVAGEFKNTDKLIAFLEKEKWPWLNLVELDRENSIWQKYGVDGGGGGLFLIDKEGIILAKDPTAEEVRKELESRLN